MMKSAVCTILCTGAAILTVSSPAHAAVLTAQSAATYSQSDGLLREAVGVGSRFWRDRGFDVAPVPVYVYNEPNSPATGYRAADARGDHTAIWFDRSYRADVWAGYTARGQTLRSRRHALEDVCQVATHEVGHTLGDALERLWPLDATGHTAYGIMAPNAHLTRLPACARWARQKLPRRS